MPHNEISKEVDDLWKSVRALEAKEAARERFENTADLDSRIRQLAERTVPEKLKSDAEDHLGKKYILVPRSTFYTAIFLVFGIGAAGAYAVASSAAKEYFQSTAYATAEDEIVASQERIQKIVPEAEKILKQMRQANMPQEIKNLRGQIDNLFSETLVATKALREVFRVVPIPEKKQLAHDRLQEYDDSQTAIEALLKKYFQGKIK